MYIPYFFYMLFNFSAPETNGAFERRLFASAVRSASPLTAETLKACSSLADVLIKTHFSANSSIFLQEVVTGLLNEWVSRLPSLANFFRKTWEEAFKEWKPLSKRFRQTQGTCELMKAALLSASNPLTSATRIGMLIVNSSHVIDFSVRFGRMPWIRKSESKFDNLVDSSYWARPAWGRQGTPYQDCHIWSFPHDANSTMDSSWRALSFANSFSA